MLPSLMVYLGLLVSFAGGLSILRPLTFIGIRTRPAGILALGAGALLVLLAWALPVGEERVAAKRTLLDEFVPAFQFHEFHSIGVESSPERAYAAVRSVTADEIHLFRTLTWIRRLGRAAPAGILNAPGDRPLLDVATRSGFLLLAEEPGREIVIGTLVAAPRGWRPRQKPTPEGFKGLRGPGFALAAMNFRIEEAGKGRSLVTTETRVFATDASTGRRFAVYWRTIYPGSSLIRSLWLRAVKRRAEGRPAGTASYNAPALHPNAEHWRKLERLYQSAPTNAYYRPTISIGDSTAEIAAEIRPEFFHAAHAVHGSVYFKLLDDAGFFAANSTVPDVFVLTASFTIHLLRPVTGGVLTAKGRLIHSGARQLLAETELFDSGRRMIGQGTGVYVRSRIALGPEIGYV